MLAKVISLKLSSIKKQKEECKSNKFEGKLGKQALKKYMKNNENEYTKHAKDCNKANLKENAFFHIFSLYYLLKSVMPLSNSRKHNLLGNSLSYSLLCIAQQVNVEAEFSNKEFEATRLKSSIKIKERHSVHLGINPSLKSTAASFSGSLPLNLQTVQVPSLFRQFPPIYCFFVNPP